MGVWVWGGCCCDFDFVGVLYGICIHCKINIYITIIMNFNCQVYMTYESNMSIKCVNYLNKVPIS